MGMIDYLWEKYSCDTRDIYKYFNAALENQIDFEFYLNIFLWTIYFKIKLGIQASLWKHDSVSGVSYLEEFGEILYNYRYPIVHKVSHDNNA